MHNQDIHIFNLVPCFRFEIDAPVELESFQQLMKPMREVPPGTDRKLDVVILGLAENEYDQGQSIRG